MLLELEDIHVHYGKIEALKGISLEVDEGEIVSLIGANGAGKTTTLKTISGLRAPVGGEILFDGRDISKMPGHQRVLAGIGQAPEGRGIFPGMTVLENLLDGRVRRARTHRRRTWKRRSSCSRGCASGVPRRRARCPAASSRCWRSGAR